MSKKATKYRNRNVSEIYFVLYLAALILLLPGKNEKKSNQAIEAITSLFQQSFSILPEKNSLLSRMSIDSAGMPVLQLDTSNVMLITGNVKDLQLECFIEDQDVGEIVKIENKRGEHFSLSYDSTKKLAFFSWRPSKSFLINAGTSKNYVVTIKAAAKPNIGMENPELRNLMNSSEAMLRSEAKFSISILTEGLGEKLPRIVYMPAETTYSRITMIQQQELNQGFSSNQFSANQQPIEEFVLNPMRPSIETIFGQQWSNTVYVRGIKNSGDLVGKPTLKIERGLNDNSGTVEIYDVKGGEFLVNGIAPLRSPMKVLVTAIRKSDLKEVTTNFTINPKPLPAAIYTQNMYPGIPYEFNPNMPSLLNIETRAILRTSSKELYNSPQGVKFTFIPEIEDTGIVVFFERHINGEKVGQRYQSKIIPYPPPEILSINNENGSIKLKTRSIGVFNGNDNRVGIVIKEGTAINVQKPQELYGNFQRSMPGMIMVQVFEIKPKDPSKPFSCTVKFVDKFGKISSEGVVSSN